MSVALEVCRLAEVHVGDAAPRLRTVAVAMGRASGLEPDNLSFCLDALLSGPPFGRGKCEIHLDDGRDIRVDYLEVDDADPDD